MNVVNLIGRLTKDPEVRYSTGQNPMAIARYSLAVDRPAKQGQDRQTDFINCVAFAKSAEFCEKYLKKGMKIGITGRIQTGSYEKDGRKIYTTDIVVQNHYFCESRGNGGNEAPAMASAPMQNAPAGFEEVDEFIPF